MQTDRKVYFCQNTQNVFTPLILSFFSLEEKPQPQVLIKIIFKMTAIFVSSFGIK
jgi:hypothetical protein